MIWWKSYENQKVMIVCIAIDSRAPWSIYLLKHIFVYIYVFVSHFRFYIRVCIIGISFNYWGLDFQMIIQQSTEVCSKRIQKHEIIDNINISSSNFRFPHFDNLSYVHSSYGPIFFFLNWFSFRSKYCGHTIDKQMLM